MSKILTNTTKLQEVLESLQNKATPSGTDTSGATATASDILDGKTAFANGKKLTGNIKTKTSSDLTVNGATVNVPAGYYASDVSKSVNTTTQATPSISVDANGKITATADQTEGYVSAGSKSGTKQLTTQGAKTITPSKSSQTAVAKNVYTTGAITVNAIPDEYITTNDATATADKIFLNESAYVDGEKVIGNFTIDEELAEQSDLLSQLAELVQTKSAPSGGGVQTATVTINTSTGTTIYYVSENGLETIQGISTSVQMVIPSICVCRSDIYFGDNSVSGECSKIIDDLSNYMHIIVTGDSTINCYTTDDY